MADVRKIILVLEYDGTDYFGFEWQEELPTIQGEIEKAIEGLTGEKLRVISASRTDSGVHARGQVVSFRTSRDFSPETFISGLNHYLPREIAVTAAYPVVSSLDVRKEAVSREYEYLILNQKTRSPLYDRFSFLVKEELDTGAMQEAGEALVGEHDFIAFASSLDKERAKNTTRRVYEASVKREEKLVIFTIVASSFLPHQVRNTVGSLLRVGLGKMSLNEFCSIMDAKKPGLAGPSAPACGLCLVKVNYPFSFEEKAE